MGTRADFYVGKGKDAEWIGSVAWDGYPDNPEIGAALASITDEAAYRTAVGELLARRKDGTTPDMGWPWPWINSHTTDYSYSFSQGSTFVSNCGMKWVALSDWLSPEFDHDKYYESAESGPNEEFPDMSAIQNTNYGERSGIIFLAGKQPQGD